MNVACDYEAPMQMLTTEKYIAGRPAIFFSVVNICIELSLYAVAVRFLARWGGGHSHDEPAACACP